MEGRRSISPKMCAINNPRDILMVKECHSTSNISTWVSVTHSGSQGGEKTLNERERTIGIGISQPVLLINLSVLSPSFNTSPPAGSGGGRWTKKDVSSQTKTGLVTPSVFCQLYRCNFYSEWTTVILIVPYHLSRQLFSSDPPVREGN